MLRTRSCVIAVTATVTAPSLTAQAEMLALRCEGTKITTEIKDPGVKEIFPKQSVGEEDKGAKDARSEERASTDVIVADQVVYAFGTEFETGLTNDAFVRFGRTANNPELTGFVLEGFFGEINRVAGTLEAEQLKYKKNGWLYLRIKYSLNCRKIERKF
jgi:hypothetical protein